MGLQGSERLGPFAEGNGSLLQPAPVFSLQPLSPCPPQSRDPIATPQHHPQSCGRALCSTDTPTYQQGHPVLPVLPKP